MRERGRAKGIEVRENEELEPLAAFVRDVATMYPAASTPTGERELPT
jgi:hypothetical protein